MAQPSRCLNCGRTEAEVPVVAWRYQGRELWICSDCLPNLIHKREQLMARWPAPTSHTAEEGPAHAA